MIRMWGIREKRIADRLLPHFFAGHRKSFPARKMKNDKRKRKLRSGFFPARASPEKNNSIFTYLNNARWKFHFPESDQLHRVGLLPEKLTPSRKIRQGRVSAKLPTWLNFAEFKKQATLMLINCEFYALTLGDLYDSINWKTMLSIFIIYLALS